MLSPRFNTAKIKVFFPIPYVILHSGHQGINSHLASFDVILIRESNMQAV